MGKKEAHYKLNDEQFEQQFFNLSMPVEVFTHEAHLRLGYILAKKHPIEKAGQLACAYILAFDIQQGKGDKFHKTITIASVSILKKYMDRSASNDFATLLQEYPVLKLDFKSLIDRHYSLDVFTNDRAWKEYIAPDLISFEK